MRFACVFSPIGPCSPYVKPPTKAQPPPLSSVPPERLPLPPRPPEARPRLMLSATSPMCGRVARKQPAQ